MKRREFLYNCMLCASALPLSGCVANISNNNIKGKCLKYVEIHIVEHCNLNCKYCGHFSCIADEEYYDVKEYEKDIAKLAEVTKSNIYRIRILGGEPLLHPEIEHIFDITRKYFPNSNIELTTNSTLIDDKPETFWKNMKKNRISIAASIYPIKLNWKSILDKAKKYNIAMRSPIEGDIITPENIEKYTIKYFQNLNIDINGKYNMYKPCSLKDNNYCIYYFHGKLYPCFVISNIRHFNKKFNQNIPVTKKDYIDVYKAKDIDELISFVNKPVPFCKYCNSYNGFRKWENSSIHTIDEWAI